MKLLIDSNIVLDLLLARKPFLKSAVALLERMEHGHDEGFITANSITDIIYICKKEYSFDAIRKEILKLLDLIDVIGVEREDIVKAFDMGFSDYEDALQSRCAMKEDIDYIITRNEKDFTKSEIKTIRPDVFLAQYKL